MREDVLARYLADQVWVVGPDVSLRQAPEVVIVSTLEDNATDTGDPHHYGIVYDAVVRTRTRPAPDRDTRISTDVGAARRP